MNKVFRAARLFHPWCQACLQMSQHPEFYNSKGDKDCGAITDHHLPLSLPLPSLPFFFYYSLVTQGGVWDQ